MKKTKKVRIFDLYVYGKDNECILVKSYLSESEGDKALDVLFELGIDAALGTRPDRIVNGRCVYDED